MHWYVSYRTGGYTVNIFKRREQVIAAAYGFLNRRYRDALEVGPMLGSSEGNLLDERDIRRIWDENPGAATRDSTAQTGSRTSRRT
jgi:hypothetical protein